MRNKITIIGLVVVFVAIIVGAYAFGSKNDKSMALQSSPAASSGIIFFYGNTCPHCAEVEKWMEENQVSQKISIVKKEVYQNQQNAKELTEAAKSCGLPTDSIGVPFLYAEGKCYIGTPDVINYLSGMVAIETPSPSPSI